MEGGCFIVLDGVDGCGKTTQAERLVRWLAERGPHEPLHVREPGSTRLGESLRELLLARELELSPQVETLLFAAARRQLVEELVQPALAAGRHVVCERFDPSTFAYQAVAGELAEDDVLDLLGRWGSPRRPDLVVLLDVPVGAATARRGEATDRIEDKGEAYQRRVAEGYRRYAERSTDRVRTLDGSREPDAVAGEIRREVERVL